MSSSLASMRTGPVAELAGPIRPSRAYRVAKRTIDLVVAGVCLPLLAPVLLVIAAVIRYSDPGAPVLYRQERCGRRGEPFTLLKFRTMVPNAHELRESLRAQSEVAWPDFRLPDDPRVTPFGRFLRRTSLDELPQLWNVLRGDMSIVGPRPTSFTADTYALWQTERLECKPGITGPWQVEGRNSMDFTERSRLEIGFFRSPSIARELGLLVRTVPVVLRRTGIA